MKYQHYYSKYIAALILVFAFVMFGITTCKSATTVTKDQAIQMIDSLIANNKLEREGNARQRILIQNGINDLNNERSLRLKAEDFAKSETRRADSEKAIADSETTRANQWEHRAEVIVELFAIAFSFWLGTVASGYLIRNFPAPESYILAAGMYILLFVAGMYVVNHFIDELGKVVPTPPSMDQVLHWTHKTTGEVKKAL